MFKIGIIGLITIVSYDIIVEIFFDDEDTYHGIFTFFRNLPENTEITPYFLLDIVFGFLWKISLWLTIYYFSPLHFIILEVISEFVETTLIIIGIKSDESPKLLQEEKITFIIIYIFIFFFILVFYEIIILNFCKLNFNTKVQIMLRQKIDEIYDIDKDGKLVPANKGLQNTTILNEEEENEDNNNEPLFQ